MLTTPTHACFQISARPTLASPTPHGLRTYLQASAGSQQQLHLPCPSLLRGYHERGKLGVRPGFDARAAVWGWVQTGDDIEYKRGTLHVLRYLSMKSQLSTGKKLCFCGTQMLSRRFIQTGFDDTTRHINNSPDPPLRQPGPFHRRSEPSGLSS